MAVESNDKSDVDLLLEALVFFTQHYRLSSSKEGLCEGLPLINGKLTPTLFVRAAERVALSTKIIR